jgi:hypothetical protein
MQEKVNSKKSVTDKKVWFVTGTGPGIGVDITKTARAAGSLESVFATRTIQGDRHPASLQ